MNTKSCDDWWASSPNIAIKHFHHAMEWHDFTHRLGKWLQTSDRDGFSVVYLDQSERQTTMSAIVLHSTSTKARRWLSFEENNEYFSSAPNATNRHTRFFSTWSLRSVLCHSLRYILILTLPMLIDGRIWIIDASECCGLNNLNRSVCNV